MGMISLRHVGKSEASVRAAFCFHKWMVFDIRYQFHGKPNFLYNIICGISVLESGNS